MRPQRIGLIALLTLLATVAIDNVQFIQNPKSKLQSSQVLAKTPDARKAEADRLLQQGMHQYDTNQFEPALQSFQQALAIYWEISDRQGQANAFYLLGNAYLNQGKKQEAIKSYQQSLAIYRGISNYQGEANVLHNMGYACNQKC
ncbi:MAG TPA: tetratricopeptide repeat protein [Allocoleopsis sp.]